jgi:hypothetical protein
MSFFTFLWYYILANIAYTALYICVEYLYLIYRKKHLKKNDNNVKVNVIKVQSLDDDDGQTWH